MNAACCPTQNNGIGSPCSPPSPCAMLCTTPASSSQMLCDGLPQNWRTKNNAEGHKLANPCNIAPRETKSNAPIASMDRNVALGSNSLFRRTTSLAPMPRIPLGFRKCSHFFATEKLKTTLLNKQRDVPQSTEKRRNYAKLLTRNPLHGSDRYHLGRRGSGAISCRTTPTFQQRQRKRPRCGTRHRRSQQNIVDFLMISTRLIGPTSPTNLNRGPPTGSDGEA